MLSRVYLSFFPFPYLPLAKPTARQGIEGKEAEGEGKVMARRFSLFSLSLSLLWPREGKAKGREGIREEEKRSESLSLSLPLRSLSLAYGLATKGRGRRDEAKEDFMRSFDRR